MTAALIAPRRRSAMRCAVLFALILGLFAPTARRAGAEAMLQLFNLSWNEVAAKIPEATRLVRVTLTGVADTDGDGLPDFWEIQNGLSPTNSTGIDGVAGDPDGDGFTNLQEYLAGTDPWDANSLLKIIDLAGAGRVITWNSIPGRNYQVFATTNVNGAFTALSGTLTAFTNPMSFTNPAPVRPREFYRVLIVP